MGSGASLPYTDEAAALAAGKTQDEIDAWKKSEEEATEGPNKEATKEEAAPAGRPLCRPAVRRRGSADAGVYPGAPIEGISSESTPEMGSPAEEVKTLATEEGETLATEGTDTEEGEMLAKEGTDTDDGSSNTECELFKAILADDDGRAKSIIDTEQWADEKPNPMQVNFVDEQGTTSLHLAASKGMEMVCCKIVGCDDFEHTDAKDAVGRTALHLLAAANIIPMVNSLLHLPGFDVNTKDKNGQVSEEEDGVVAAVLGCAGCERVYMCAATSLLSSPSPPAPNIPPPNPPDGVTRGCELRQHRRVRYPRRGRCVHGGGLKRCRRADRGGTGSHDGPHGVRGGDRLRD
jgi:hypothetical protein